ncbi:MAG: hypothetical protein PHO63_04120 [Bacilli bacterium]|nr:hypothetical protein [Bacilli bacterium]MDD4809155.1 hypothetical protein [Bacilli bacterium]
MKKIISSIIIMFVLIFINIQILIDSKEVLANVLFSLETWKTSLVPSLFPMLIIADVLIAYGFVELVGELFKPLMNYLFKASGTSAFIFIMSMISGFPSSAKYIKELYQNNLIDKHEASKALTFCHFSNPLFLLGTVSLLLGSNQIGLLILLCHYLGNFIVGFIFRNYYPTTEKSKTIDFKKAILNMHNKRISNKQNFIQIITNSLVNGIDTLLLILGIIITFSIITTILNINNYYSGILEITQGIKYLSLSNFSLELKAIIATLMISFGGFSIHMQVTSILSDIKVKYEPFFIARILHAIISSFLVLIVCNTF